MPAAHVVDSRHRFTSPFALLLIFALVAAYLTVLPGAAPSAAAPAGSVPGILADFEDGAPPGFFVFSGGGSSVGTTPVTLADDAAAARPGQVGDNGVLDVSFDVSDFGGFGQAFEDDGPQDWRATEGFRLWFKGAGSGAVYTLELSGARSNPATDTSTRYNTTFVDGTDGWTLVELPWENFALSTGFQPGGAPLDPDLTLDEIWAWAIVLPQAEGSLLVDDVGIQPIRADDLEYDELPSGMDGGAAIGFSTFQDASSSVAIDVVTTPDAPVLPHLGPDNRMLRMDLDVNAFAGFAHAFTDGTSWTPQDWSTSSSFGFWFHGNDDGTQVFVDVLGARNPDSTRDDAQRWTVEFTDDHAGWAFRSWPFEALRFKPIGNGAPGGVGDTFDPSVVHGWAVGTLGTGGPVTYYVDELVRFGSAEDRPLTVGLAATETRVTEGGTAAVRVRLSRPLREGEGPVEVDFRTEPGSAAPGRTYEDVEGTLVFAEDGPTELTFEVETYDDGKRNYDRTVIVRLDGPADLLRTAQGWITIVDDEVTDAALLDDVEQTEYEFDPIDAELSRIELEQDDDRARPDQDRFEGVLEVAVDDIGVAAATATTVSIDPDQVSIRGACQNRGNAVVQVIIHGSGQLPVSAIDHTSIRVGDAQETHTDPRTGEPWLRVRDVDRDGFDDLIVHVRMRETGLTCATLTGGVTAAVEDATPAPLGGVARSWADARDISGAEAISFWFEGTGSGEEHTFRLRDNAAPDPGPDGWELIWSDEFDQPEGTPPDPANWSFELGDGTVNQIPGWGNDELQYYTDAPENVRHDGEGNLVIDVLEIGEGEDGPPCYYGPCQYTSARLISQYKQDFQYGRMEAAVQVPEGDGLWPAFWALGTDIPEVGWPQTGEIDIMEVVGRLPSTVFGTIHGPGYAGGQSFGGTTSTAPDGVADAVREFAVEWQPGEIVWEFDGERFLTATPEDVSPNEWVFDHPFFLLLNVAVGGNFGGAVGPDTTFPQRMTVEYVRVHGAPDTAERFETTFVDEVAGWQRVTIPFTDLVRSDDQPEGAPDDGLTLTGARGYEILAPAGTTFRIDDVRLSQPEEVTVTSADDAGPGTLRSALSATAAGGTITIDPELAGGMVELAAPLVATRSVTIDTTAAPGFTLDAGDNSRVLEVGPGANVTLLGGTLTGGSHALQGGAVRVAGSLRLEDVTLVDNRTTGGDDFNHGGGAIFVADGGILEVVDSKLTDNTSGFAGGALWAGFDSRVTISDSEVTDNAAADVGGALRTLGTLDVTDSTFTNNRSNGWHGGALFVTDGVATVRGSIFDGNPGADGANTSLFVGTFSDASASLVLGGNTARNVGGEVCFLAPFGSGAVSIVSEGGNTFGDATCNPRDDDIVEP